MKAAFSTWSTRIAPVFDIAPLVHIVETESGQIVGRADEILPDDLPAQKVMRLAELGVGTLVCGAISWPLHAMVTAYGIQVVPFVAGSVSEVVQAWLAGTVGREAFAMPGRRGRGCRAAGVPGPEACLGGRRRRGGAGQGGGRGQNPDGRCRSRRRGPLARGVVGTCVCPVCGHREPHERGVSSVQRPCPSCGAQMTSES